MKAVSVSRSVGMSVDPSLAVRHIFEFWAVFALLLLQTVRDWIAVNPALFFQVSVLSFKRHVLARLIPPMMDRSVIYP